MKNILLAEQSGFCFGVQRAVNLVIECQKKKNKKVYTLGPLIHNNDVIRYLEEKHIYPITIDDLCNLKKGDVVVIRSHGVPLKVIEEIKSLDLEIVDATCPYVKNIQRKVKKYHELGYGIIIVGDKNHPEVKGINGWCENSAIVAKNEEDISLNLPKKVCVVSQTTEKEYNWQNVLNFIIKNCKEIVAFNTICSATEVRQKCAEELSKKVDAMVVIGGKHSSNTTKLYEICKKNCANTVHIENILEIPNYILEDETIKNIGVTAGASTPNFIINEVIDKISNY